MYTKIRYCIQYMLYTLMYSFIFFYSLTSSSFSFIFTRIYVKGLPETGLTLTQTIKFKQSYVNLHTFCTRVRSATVNSGESLLLGVLRSLKYCVWSKSCQRLFYVYIKFNSWEAFRHTCKRYSSKLFHIYMYIYYILFFHLISTLISSRN